MYFDNRIKFSSLFLISFVLLSFWCGLSFTKSPPYQELYYDQQVDHYNYYSTPSTFKQRYLINDSSWDPAEGSIFLYTGNEGDIEYFWSSCGYMFELAPSFGAYVIFIEHRYYGKSWPFSEDEAFINGNNRFLSTEQALADFAEIIDQLQEELANKAGSSLKYRRYPVFAFGGSYGGMLSGWFRLQYPYIVDAALASSAPIPMASLPDRRASDNYWKVITDAYQEMSPKCPDLVRKGFSSILEYTGDTQGYKILTDRFSLCPPIQSDDDIQELILWIANAYSSLAMGNYPTANGYLPAWPLNVSCEIILDNENDPLQGLVEVANFFWNDTTLQCFDMYSQYVLCADITGCGDGPSGSSWDYQACSEMIYYPAMNNVTDMFPPFKWDLQLHSDYCYSTWNIESRLEWTSISLGGSEEDFKSTSRIIFSNGLDDPWSSGGFLEYISDSLPVIIIPASAHHLDLRETSSSDPQCVIDARNQEKDILLDWFDEIKNELS